MRARGEGRGGLFLGRFYFSKWLTLPVLGHKKVLVLLMIIWIFRKAIEQVEKLGGDLYSLLKTSENKKQEEFENKSADLLKRVESVRVAMDTSYKKISNHNLDQLREFQVIIRIIRTDMIMTKIFLLFRTPTGCYPIK